MVQVHENALMLQMKVRFFPNYQHLSLVRYHDETVVDNLNLRDLNRKKLNAKRKTPTPNTLEDVTFFGFGSAKNC